MEMKESNKFILEVVGGVAILLFALISGTFFRMDDVKEVEKAIKTQENLLELRIALESYYQLTGKYPDFTNENASEDLKKVPSVMVGNKEIFFKDVYGRKKIMPTEGTNKIKENNKINIVENLKNITLDGGWNYNSETGEIHGNLPTDIYFQNINWLEE